MKKACLVFIVFLLCRLLPAPNDSYLVIEKKPAINGYEPLIKALVCVETDHGKDFYNEIENAVGPFQIRQIRVDDYNQRTGSNYQLKDFYDYDLSKKMFLYYAQGKDYETTARNWNGSGPMTIEYWNKVKRHI